MDGYRLSGGSGSFGRVDDDFYATDRNSVRDLFRSHKISGESFYEPCVGQGHIVDVIKEFNPLSTIDYSDIIDRGYNGTVIRDFIKDDFRISPDWIITNPPYKLAKEFIDRSLLSATVGVAMFLKLVFLESVSRRDWLKNSPLRYVYVFSKRQSPLRDGSSLNPLTGKKMSSTICFAWFIWEIGYTGEPVIRWI
jgi:hypothetical protein